MSIKVMTYVWDHSRHKGTELLTLLALADCAHDDGTQAYPSIAFLAKKTRMKVRNVQYVLKKLEASHELRIERGAGPQGCHLFTIPMEGASFVPLTKGGANLAGCKPLHRGGAKQRQKGVQAIAPKPSEEPLDEPSEEGGKAYAHAMSEATSSPQETPALVMLPRPRHLSHTVPEDFMVTEDMRIWAQMFAPLADLDFQTQKFRLWEFPTPASEWVLKWKGWMLDAHQKYTPQSQRHSQYDAANWKLEEANHESA
jgi:Helix-turn-helix domain